MKDPFDMAESTLTVTPRAGAAATIAGPSVRVVRSPDRQIVGSMVALTSPELVVGRASTADLVVKDEGISRHHIRFVREAAGVRVVDLDSRNGMWVNGAPCKEAQLKSGDLIEIGANTLLEFVSGAVQAQLREALRAARVATWEFDPRRDVIEFAESADSLLGLPWGALGGPNRKLAEVVHAEDLERVRADFGKASGGSQVHAEFRLPPPHGQRWLVCDGNVVVRGSETFVAGTATDITDRRLAQEELQRHATIFESLPDAVFVTTLVGQVLDANPAAAKLFTLDRSNVVGRELLELLRAPARVAVASVAQTVRSEGRYFTELELEASNGAQLTCEASVVALRRGVSTETVGLLWTLRDISQHKQLLRQLGMAERLAAMGTLSAGVAHEINNPLSFIVANLSYLQEELRSSDDATREELDLVVAESLEGARRITAIVKDLKAFAREGGSTGDPVPVDVGRAVELAHKLAVHTLRHRAHVSLSVEKVPAVLGHEHRITQVVLNLLLNAGQAIPETHTGAIAVRVFSPWPNQTAIEVSDSGSGIAADVLPHIFDPFFTTKPVGVGTGLGLSIVHGIVTSLGGTVEVESMVGKGTRFTVVLPGVATPEIPIAAESPAPTVGNRKARVLIVDDEPMVVSSLSRHLKGHQVVGRQSAREALELLERDAFDVVLCDLLMPGMTGMELHDLVSQRLPGVASRFVFMTGGAITERAANFVSTVQAPVLRKPVDLELLRRTIVEVASMPLRARAGPAVMPSP